MKGSIKIKTDSKSKIKVVVSSKALTRIPWIYDIVVDTHTRIVDPSTLPTQEHKVQGRAHTMYTSVTHIHTLPEADDPASGLLWVGIWDGQDTLLARLPQGVKGGSPL